mmetsp:Transcript_6529/g.13791  ORF Transcript_6529/g.13791 Transcript_6529/m.13791 type:complete len:423 (+) Transcript_6529:38-1306(+)
MTDVMPEVDEEERVRILKARIAELEAADDAEESDDDVQIMEEPSSSPPPSSGDDEAEEETTTTAQEAVNSQKSRRSREFEELRKLAANRKSEEGGELSAYERMQLKKQEELDALRARGDVNAANKSRFDTGQALTTDMSAFERTQKLAAEQERKKRLEASEGLKKNASGISSWDRNQLLGKDEARKRQMEAKEGLHSYRLSLNPSKSYDESPEKKPVVVAAAAQEAEKDSEHNVDEVIPKPKQENPIEKEQEPETAVKSSLPKAKEDAAAKPQSSYSRLDIKFSFGLVVKSGTTDESLRESETLRKCMNGTRDILTEELPAPPKQSDITADSNVSSKVKFPQAYYDPILEPTVISIQEDTSKKPAKGKNNTRTLCKASFPIFIREETKDDDGKKRAALSLKETKATIFKALRAAVSGGNFLK